MEESEFKKILIVILAIFLLALAFLILKPIIISVLAGVILAYLFSPIYRRLNKKLNSPSISAFIILLGITIVVILPIIFLIPLIIRQLVNVYILVRSVDLVDLVSKIFPTLFQTQQSSADLSAILTSVNSIAANFLSGLFRTTFMNLPSILLQIAIILFTFFFVLRDHMEIKQYFFAISPFKKESQERFYTSFEQITNSILYGQVIVGIVQGLVAGIGYLIFGVEGALLLTLLTILAGIIPVLGTWLVWGPVTLYLFSTGQTVSATGLLIYGVFIVSWIDNLIRPLIISRVTKMNTGIAFVGMIGGLYAFGIIGLILGPLVLAYLLLIMEFYKERKAKSIILETNPSEAK